MIEKIILGKSSSIAYYKEQKLPPSFEQLKRHGLRITSYEEKKVGT
jgi:hypothetical protein